MSTGQVDLITCTISGSDIQCSDKSVTISGERVFNIDSKHEISVLFKHGIKETVICSGIEFQVYAWGLDKYTIWILPPGLNQCILIKDVYLDQCNEYFYLVSRNPIFCDETLLIECEKKIMALSNSLRTPIFVFADLEPPTEIPNIVRHGNIEKCSKILLDLISLLKLKTH